MKTEWTNGSHKLRFIPPDILCSDILGPILIEEAKESNRIIVEEVFPMVGKVFYFINLVASPGINSEVRKYFASVNPPLKGVAIIGGSRAMRLAANLATRVMSMLNGNMVPTQMVETFEEACAFAQEVRAAERAGAAARQAPRTG